MPSRRFLFSIVGAAIVIGGVILLRPHSPRPSPDQPGIPPIGLSAGGRMPFTQPQGSTPGSHTETPALTAIRAAATALKSGIPSDPTRPTVTQLRAQLDALPHDAASTAAREFLTSKTDAPTGQGFKVGADGFLEASPSLRVFLLDYLGRIDPVSAAQYAELILASKDSPDEWAVALRSYALGHAGRDGQEFLGRKFIELARHEPWQREPSVGFLEAFDVAVAAGGPTVTATVADLVRQTDNPAVAHAAYLACDRLVLSQPTATLALLQDQPDLMAGREVTRANYFARANVQDGSQRQVLEQYLLDPKHGPAEIDAFAGLYPSANYMLSNNLLTKNATPDGAALARQDAAALATVTEWLADPRFTRLRPQLQKVNDRLQTFARQRGSASPPQ